MKIKTDYISNIIIVLLILSYVLSLSILTILFPISSSGIQLAKYGSMFLIMILFFKGFHVNYRMLLVVIAASLSLIINSVEAKYNAPFRLLSWILMVAMIGPLVYSPSLIRFRDKLLESFFKVFMVIGGLSFVYWLLGIPSLGRGHFSGLMGHSMVLAPVAALGGLYAFYRFIHEPKGKKKLLFLGLFVFSTLDVVLAASRIALLGFVLGFSVFLFFNKFRFRKLILLVLAAFAISIVSTMNTNAANMTEENSVETEMLERGLDNTREQLWEDRIMEFKSSPIFGVGFASQDNTIVLQKGEGVGGNVEPGSTYLMILSMTGLLGAAALFYLFLKPMFSKRFWKRISSSERYKLAAFVFFAVHFVSEGYIYSSGSLMACVFWVLVGTTYPYAGINYNKVLKEN